jgi:hypothetical protein
LASEGHDTRSLQHYLGQKKTSATPCDTSSWHRTNLRASGRTNWNIRTGCGVQHTQGKAILLNLGFTYATVDLAH